MLNEVKEISEMSMMALEALNFDIENGFKVEGVPAPASIILENDTLIPVIALYCNHIGGLLFNDKDIYSQKIYYTEESLFFVKMDDSISKNNFVARHIKILIIKKFFESIMDNEKNINLSKLINSWRVVFRGREEKSTVSLSIKSDAFPLSNEEISCLFEQIEIYI